MLNSNAYHASNGVVAALQAIVRHPLVRQEAGQALCSRSTIWGGTCYVSCIRPSATQQLDEEPAEEQLAAEYETQARNVRRLLGK